MMRLSTLLCLAVVTVLTAFTVRINREPVLPETPYNYANIVLPEHFSAPGVRIADNTPTDNPITDEGATLGRVLFYDTRLSRNETTSCASCHHQDRAFSDPARFSEGFSGVPTDRNSMGLAFARFYQNGRYFWDERAETLEHQVLMPIEDPVEMGLTLDEAVARLEATTFYSDLFEDAFGTPTMTPERMSKALAQFVRSIVAPNSRYDQGRPYQEGRGQPLPNFTEEENLGLKLFSNRALCSECHAGDLMLNDRPLSNGLDVRPADQGAGAGRFKVPSLRNIELTAPYMHDGRFETLEEVVEHYNSGIQPHFALFASLRAPGLRQPVRMNLSDEEKAALVAFLKTLTDETLATDPRWSDPFDETASD